MQVSKPTHRYTGQLAQAELGLDYYVARFYDPLTGHFTQADTLIPEPGKASAFDRYAYVRNNPIRYSDPSGHGIDCGIGDPDCDRSGDLKRWREYTHITNRSNNDQLKNNIKTSQEKKKDLLSTTLNHEISDTPITDSIKSFPGTSEQWALLGKVLDVTAEIIDIYSVGVVITGGIIGAGITSPAVLAGAPEVPILSGAAGAVIAEIYVQNTLFLSNFLATGGTFATIVSDTKSDRTIIETGKLSNTTTNSIVFTIIGWNTQEAIMSLTFQSTVLLNDFGVTSIPWQ